LTIVKKIEEGFNNILDIATSLDGYLQEKTGSWEAHELIPEKAEDYWKTRESFEEEISSWMGNIRKAINSLPSNIRRTYREERTSFPSGEIYSVINYDNKDYESIVWFQKKIVYEVEGRGGVISLLTDFAPIFKKLRDIRGTVLSLCRTLETLVPEIMVTIEQQVELIFKLREKGIDDAALLIEELDQIEENIKKCTNIRSALEKVVEAYCKEKEIEIKKGFYTNLDNAIKAGLDEKKKRNAITGNYSFVSKIIHNELDANSRNTQFAVNGILNVLHGFPWIMT